MNYDGQDLLIGVNYGGYAVGGGYQREFKGIIDDLRILDRVLTPSEVWQLYNAPE